MTLAWAAVVALLLSSLAVAADESTEPTASSSDHREARVFTSKHVGRFNGVRIAYTAKVAETLLTNAKGAPTASVFTIAYTADRDGDPAERPVVFLFNGGPGASSLWVHMGGFGPKRVPFSDDLQAGVSAPYALVDNEQSLLEVADLVFLDPAGTGFSRILRQEEKSRFYSTPGDAEYLAEVINRWVHENGRENSPKYILGESYGTIRAPVLAQKLAESHSAIRVNGLILIGPAVTLGETATRPGNVLAYALSLTYMAATAWYHDKVDKTGGDFEAFLEKVRRFAIEEYLPALAQGRFLAESRRGGIAAQLQRFTGLPAELWLRNDLAIKKTEFNVELLRNERLVLGANDSRYTAPAPAGLQGDAPVDPSMYTLPALVAGLNRHLRDNLGVRLPQPYVVMDHKAGAQWDWGPPNSPFSDLSWASVMSALMKNNPQMRLFYAVGYYDPKTTVGATEYTVARADYPLERVELRRYHGGHMIYTDERSHRELARDIREFIRPRGSQS